MRKIKKLVNDSYSSEPDAVLKSTIRCPNCKFDIPIEIYQELRYDTDKSKWNKIIVELKR